MNDNEKLLERLKELEKRYSVAVHALEFIAFNNAGCWKDADRRKRAASALVEIGEYQKT